MMRALCLEMCESQMELAECVCVCVCVCECVCERELAECEFMREQFEFCFREYEFVPNSALR